MTIKDLNNGGSCGLLLNWEFGVEVNDNEDYSVSGTVSW